MAKGKAKANSAELTQEQLGQLAEVAQFNRRLAKNMAAYERHTTRIRTLERVLDPKDEAAVGNPANEDGYRAELDRRRGELVKVTAYLQQALAAAEA